MAVRLKTRQRSCSSYIPSITEIKDAIHKDHSDKHADKHADKHIAEARSPIGSRSTTPTPASQQRGTITPNQSYQGQGNALNPSGAGPAGAGIVGVRDDRSAGATPPPAPPTVRSGLLKIRVTSAKGLSLPEGSKWDHVALASVPCQVLIVSFLFSERSRAHSTRSAISYAWAQSFPLRLWLILF